MNRVDPSGLLEACECRILDACACKNAMKPTNFVSSPDNHRTMTPSEIKASNRVHHGSLSDYVTAGFGGGIHILFGGINGSYDVTSKSATVCLRLGLGMYIGGGLQVGVNADKNITNNVPWSVGVGGDVAYGTTGEGGQIVGNTDGVTASAGARIPNSSLGIGASAGIDCCMSF